MITGIRSAILCDRVVRHPDGMIDYLGLYGDTIPADPTTGKAVVWFALILELDGKGAHGEIQFQADGYDFRAPPVMTPPGVSLTTAVFPLDIPVASANTLRMTVVNVDRRDKPFRVAWTLVVDDGFDAPRGPLN